MNTRPMIPTEQQVRDTLKKVQSLFSSFANCPVCGEVDFKKEQGRHADYCFYEELMEMEL